MFRKSKLWLPGAVYLVAIFVLNEILPAWTGKENSLLENIQMLCLLGGLVFSYRMLTCPLEDWGGDQKSLWYASLLYFFTLGMREISWGRALLQHADGSNYSYSEMGLYGQLVHPLVGVLIVLMLFFLYRAKLWRFLTQVKISTVNFILLLAFIFCGWLGEKGPWLWFHTPVAEELSEIGAYAMMVYLVYEMVQVAGKRKNNQ